MSLGNSEGRGEVVEEYSIDEYTLVRIVRRSDGSLEYRVIQPVLDERERVVVEDVRRWFLEELSVSDMGSTEKLSLMIDLAVRRFARKRLGKKVRPDVIARISYIVKRDILGFGKLDPLLKDPNIEDIHVVGVGRPVFVWHRLYESIPTNIYFFDPEELNRHLHKLMLVSGKFASLSRPIVDGTLPMGYRVHVVHPVVSELGAAITIRKYREVPFTVADLMKFGTVYPELLALLWVALEHKRSIFIVGETAAGKSFPGYTLIPVRIKGEVRIMTVQELYDIVKSREYRVGEHLVKDVDDIEVLGLDKDFKVKWMRVKRIIRHKDSRPLVKVRTNSSVIVTTRDHNFVKLDPETLELLPVKAEELRVGDIIVNAWITMESSARSKVDPDYAYLLGLWIGDGTVDVKREYVEFINSDEELINTFKILSLKYWNGQIYLVKDRRNDVKYLRVKSRKAIKDVLRLFKEKKSRTVSIPEEILFSSKDVCTAVLAGILDTDGTIMIREGKQKRVTVEFSTRSKMLANAISFILKRLRILHTLKERIVRGEPLYRIVIYDVAAKQLLELTYKWSRKARKYKDVVSILVSSKGRSPNINTFPIGPLMKKVRTMLKIPEALVENELGLSSRYLYAYERGSRTIGLDNLRKFYEYYKRKAIEMNRDDVLDTLKKVEKLLDSDLLTEKVLSIEEVKASNEWLYDLEVDGTHLFVVGQTGWRLNHNTTLLNAIATLIPTTMKVVVIEEVREIRLPHPNVIYMITKEGVDTAGRVTLYDLVKASMRQRPDFIIVGEVRGEEAYVLMQSISLGHGGLCLPEDQLVPMIVDGKFGLYRIGDIVWGVLNGSYRDVKVLTQCNGEVTWRNVSRVYVKSGSRRFIRIIPSNGVIHEVHEEHPVIVYDDGKLIVKSARKLRRGDLLLSLINTDVKLSNLQRRALRTVLEELLNIYGESLSNRGDVEVLINDRDVAEYLALISKSLGMHPSVLPLSSRGFKLVLTKEANREGSEIRLLSSNYALIPVSRVEVIEKDSLLYDIEVPGSHTYFISGGLILTHNSTMHAEGPISAVKRLMAPPMNIPPYLVKLLDIIIHITKVRGRNGVRRYVLSATEIEDIDLKTNEPKLRTIYKISVDTESPKAPTAKLIRFEPEKSLTLKKISDIKGIPLDYLIRSIRKRTEFLRSLVRRGLSYEEVINAITRYSE